MPKAPIEKLPAEMLCYIVQQLVGTDVMADPYSYVYPSVPASLCLVNGRWNQILTPLLYCHYKFTAHPNQMKSLWCFLRTVVTRPELARLVRQLTVITTQPYAFYASESQVEFLKNLRRLYESNESWLTTAYTQAGWVEPTINRPFRAELREGAGSDSEGDNESIGPDDTLAALAKLVLYDFFFTASERPDPSPQELARCESFFRRSYHDPLVALLSAHCPDLLRLSTHASFEDPFHDDILCWAAYSATDRSCPKALAFQRLENLSILPSIPYRGVSLLACTDILLERPYYRLPKLKEFFAMNARVKLGWAGPVAVEHNSSIERLTIGAFPRDRFDYDNFFGMMKNLTHLTISLPRDSTVIHGPSLHDTVWKSLKRFQDQLEYLDIYQGNFHYLPADDAFPNDDALSFCPPLPKFTKLKYLATTPLLLYGHNCHHGKKRRLKQHLPPHLVSLGLYTENNDWLKDHITYIDTELTDLVEIASRNDIQSIVVDSAPGGAFPIETIRDGCARWQVKFRANGGNCLFFGGYETAFMDVSRPDFTTDLCQFRLHAKQAAEIIPRGMKIYGFEGKLNVGRRWQMKRAPGLRDAQWARTPKKRRSE
ncbi:uncharacterized protein BJX67DRAFT_386531 [Aspergillus lucknowensis]|uniref:F-box domain-containing protein n=1 Tax=Aspergillus lucknowensis TaxID=176173 RepID=A0ABR4L5S6_9EURO